MEQPTNHQVQIDGMNKHSDTGLSASGCMQPDAVSLNHADMFVPVLTRRINIEPSITLHMMTRKEITATIRSKANGVVQDLRNCTIRWERGYAMYIYSFGNIDLAIKNAIESKAWGVNWSLITKPV